MKISEQLTSLFYGHTIGDALGLATENMDKNEVLRFYPNGVQDFFPMHCDKHRSRWEPGAWTDDTDQLLCIINSIIECNEINPEDIAKRLLHWFNTKGLGAGATFAKTVRLPGYVNNPTKAAEITWKNTQMKSAANGAIMRNSFMGVYQFHNEEKLLENTEIVCRLTHADPRCIDSCKMHSLIIARELQGNPMNIESQESFIRTLDPRVSDYINLHEDQIENLGLDQMESMGYTLKTLAAALWAYNYAPSFRSGIESIVNQGGDADTNACVAGSLLGLKFGIESIPLPWINGLIDKEILDETIASVKSLIIKQ